MVTILDIYVNISYMVMFLKEVDDLLHINIISSIRVLCAMGVESLRQYAYPEQYLPLVWKCQIFLQQSKTSVQMSCLFTEDPENTKV